MNNATPRIFINYRTGDQELAALLLDTALSHRYGPDRVFLASRCLVAGRAFDTGLLAAVRECTVLLAVIGRSWLTMRDEPGRKLLHRRQDWVRLEIAEALARGVPVIPVLIEDTARLDPACLPASIRKLAKNQFVRLRHRSFRSDFGYLVSQLDELHDSFFVWRSASQKMNP
jgi:hypothetical protein